MIHKFFVRLLPRRIRHSIKARTSKLTRAWIDKFHSYDSKKLQAALRELGIDRGDTILLHCAFSQHNGYRGTPQSLIDCLIDAIGTEGTLVMVSMPYTDSTREYLEGNPVFDRQRTASRMGIVTEVFRRRGAIRSLSPTHPVLAVGTNAVLITEEHENCRYPCGPGSPFEKLYKLDAKMLFFDLPFVGFTFIHYIEHLLRDQLAFSLYDRDALAAYYLDADGKTKSIDVYVFSAEATHRRKVEVLTGELTRRDKARWKRIGNTLLVVSGTRDAVETAVDLAKNGILPFE